MEQDPALSQYRAYRRMHAANDRFNQEGSLEAWTECDGRSFQFQVVRENGSEYIRQKILRAVLEREREVITGGNAERAALTSANYEFSEPALDAEGERYVLLKPKRKDVLLVDGRMVLSEDGTEVLRVEGKLAKNPSFWTSGVKVVRHFARLDGVRVPIAAETIAKIRFVGMSQMQVNYEYESINGRPVSLAARRTMAPGVER